MKPRPPRPFVNYMTYNQTLLGWIYLPLHFLVLPLLLSLYVLVSPEATEIGINMVYFGIGVVFCFLVFFRYYRVSYYVFLDAPARCLAAIAAGLIVDYALSLLSAAALIALGLEGDSPNNGAVMDLAGQNYGFTVAMAVFVAPIVEETLFRGVVFGSLRKKHRVLAYCLSAVLFGFFHIWQYAVAAGDPAVLLYLLQYLPVSLVLAWTYDYTGSIWTSIFFHMGFNALSFAVLGG